MYICSKLFQQVKAKVMSRLKSSTPVQPLLLDLCSPCSLTFADNTNFSNRIYCHRSPISMLLSYLTGVNGIFLQRNLLLVKWVSRTLVCRIAKQIATDKHNLGAWPVDCLHIRVRVFVFAIEFLQIRA